MVETAPNEEALGSLVAAARWLEHSLTGSVATAISTMAVAMLGVSLLTGRFPLRRAASVIIGCFVLFSANLIGDALAALASERDQDTPIQAAVESPALPPLPSSHIPNVYDPYQGAAVPRPEQGGHDIFQN